MKATFDEHAELREGIRARLLAFKEQSSRFDDVDIEVYAEAVVRTVHAALPGTRDAALWRDRCHLWSALSAIFSAAAVLFVVHLVWPGARTVTRTQYVLVPHQVRYVDVPKRVVVTATPVPQRRVSRRYIIPIQLTPDGAPSNDAEHTASLYVQESMNAVAHRDFGGERHDWVPERRRRPLPRARRPVLRGRVALVRGGAAQVATVAGNGAGGTR